MIWHYLTFNLFDEYFGMILELIKQLIQTSRILIRRCEFLLSHFSLPLFDYLHSNDTIDISTFEILNRILDYFTCSVNECNNV